VRRSLLIVTVYISHEDYERLVCDRCSGLAHISTGIRRQERRQRFNNLSRHSGALIYYNIRLCHRKRAHYNVCGKRGAGENPRCEKKTVNPRPLLKNDVLRLLAVRVVVALYCNRLTAVRQYHRSRSGLQLWGETRAPRITGAVKNGIALNAVTQKPSPCNI